jgi:hypothetical protein
MSTYTEKGHVAKGCGIGLHHPQRTQTESDIAKKKWVKEYSHRLLIHWWCQQTPFGVARTYAEHIREYLTKCYEDPLKKTFIETAYRWHWSDCFSRRKISREIRLL